VVRHLRIVSISFVVVVINYCCSGFDIPVKLETSQSVPKAGLSEVQNSD